MTFSVSHWSGRLGNNIQQIANCIMAAEKYKSTFRQKLDHDIISKYDVNFEKLLASDWYRCKVDIILGNLWFIVRKVSMKVVMKRV